MTNQRNASADRNERFWTATIAAMLTLGLPGLMVTSTVILD